MIQGIAYINLKHRIDRRDSILSNIKKRGFDMNMVHRIEASLNELCGHIGCGQSHVLALELAIKNDWDSVLILEDDFVFCQTTEYINDILKKLEDIEWDVVLLADGHKNIVDSDHIFLKKIISCTTTSGYIIRKHYYATLLENFKKSVETMEIELTNHIKNCNDAGKPVSKLHYCSAIDKYWFSLQDKDTFYLCNPVLGNQNSRLYSDNSCSIERQEHQRKKIEKK